MLRRIPVSLRFDDDESEFYYGFIEQKKNDRELSSLILDLLHVYFDNEEVKQIVDDYVISKSPYLHIHEQLERIALEHSRQSVSTDILDDFTDNARKKVSEPSEPVEKKPKEQEDRLMLGMPEIQNMIKDEITKAFSAYFGNNNPPSSDIIENVSLNVEESLKKNTTQKPKIEDIQIMETVEENKKVERKEEVPVQPVQKRKKPDSFGKLLSSVK